ncbi:hypothetical protein RHSIM_Rhsim12G0213500 [Rhododendron simsii]|uniref:26S proteasome regulatory subunit 7-like OB domain-containing protein n=1 Tax=Rhododendron simsii TaxID=118357 RepID=A0A834L892_RHOSS|nr:hypothetical protein RHSIM_Rhsim12G0213500 [Rhododendron simsii]
MAKNVNDRLALASDEIAELMFVVGLGDKVSPTDIEEGMRVGSWHKECVYGGWNVCDLSTEENSNLERLP